MLHVLSTTLVSVGSQTFAKICIPEHLYRNNSTVQDTINPHIFSGFVTISSGCVLSPKNHYYTLRLLSYPIGLKIGSTDYQEIRCVRHSSLPDRWLRLPALSRHLSVHPANWPIITAQPLSCMLHVPYLAPPIALVFPVDRLVSTVSSLVLQLLLLVWP